ncbi:MAG: hypothetical protein WBP10_17455 [Thermoanaerobaculia bacterium]
MPEGPPGVASNPYCLRLVSPRSQVSFGEPLILVAELTNCSKQERQIRQLLAPEFGLLSIQLRRPGDDESTPYYPAVRRDGRGVRSRELAPGEALTTWIPVYFGRDGWLLDRPGKYTITASYDTEEGSIDAEPLVIEVAEPASPADGIAAERLMSWDAAKFLYLAGGKSTGEGLSSLESIVQEFPESRAAAYARVALGEWMGREAFDATVKEFRPHSCQEAVPLLASALEQLDDAVWAARASVALEDCFSHLGNPAAARQVAESFFARHPQAGEIPGLTDRVKEHLQTE